MSRIQYYQCPSLVRRLVLFEADDDSERAVSARSAVSLCVAATAASSVRTEADLGKREVLQRHDSSGRICLKGVEHLVAHRVGVSHGIG